MQPRGRWVLHLAVPPAPRMAAQGTCRSTTLCSIRLSNLMHPIRMQLPPAAANMLAVAHERQQKLSLLQYELAVAQEDLATLRQQRALGGAESGPQSGGRVEQPAAGNAAAAGAGSGDGSELAPAELRSLHRAVLAHLYSQGLKLAAMTLSKEAQLPPAAAAASPAAAPGGGSQLVGWYLAAQQLGPETAQRRQLERQTEEQGQQLAQLQRELEASRKAEQAAAAELEFVRGKLGFLQDQMAQQAQHAQQPQQGSQQQQQQQQGMQQYPAGAAQEHPPQQQTPAFTAVGAAGALVEVAACMPRVLPNLLINKRDGGCPNLSACCPVCTQLAGLYCCCADIK